MKILRVSIVSRLALLAAFLLLTACGAGMTKKEDASVVDQRAVERWNLLIAKQADKAYEYLTPGYRKTKPRDIYAAEMDNRPVHWKKVRFVSKDCDDTVCHVRLLVDYTVSMNAGIGREASSVEVIKEDWLNVEGRWYYLPPALGSTTPK